MDKKKFKCKMVDIPVITGFLLASMERDIVDFLAYSPLFANPFMDNVRIKQVECYAIVRAVDVLKHQKVVKVQIDDRLVKMRIGMNQIEGYLKLGAVKLDIKFSDFGIKAIRTAIAKGDLESAIAEGHRLITNLKRNKLVLLETGLKPEAIDSMEALINEIDVLNENHNSKKDERSRAVVVNYTKLNELMVIDTNIMDAGRALYRGVDNVKYKEYTLSHLLKRVHSESNSTTPTLQTKPKATDNNQPA